MLKSVPASTTLNSDKLLAWAKQLTSRPQYAFSNNPNDAGVESVVIAKACRVEETDEHRLALAGLVLAAAVNLLVWETQSEKFRAGQVSSLSPTEPGGFEN